MKGDESVRPNREVLMSEWLDAVDACFEENFICNAKNKDKIGVEMEMMVGQEWDGTSDVDKEAYFDARDKYIEGVVELTARVAKEAQKDPEMSLEVKAMWAQMQHKVAIVLCIPDPKIPWRPWFPLLTRSVYKMLVRRFEAAKETIREVSCRQRMLCTCTALCRYVSRYISAQVVLVADTFLETYRPQ